MPRNSLKVLVGEAWPEEVQIAQDRETEATESAAKTRIVHSLGIGAGLLMATFAGYGMVRADGALIDRVFNLVEWVLIGLLGWAVGRSHG